MTQADIAVAIGVSVEFYGRIERDQALPSVVTLAGWVAALDLGLDAILVRAAGGALPVAAPPAIPRRCAGSCAACGGPPRPRARS